MHPERACSHLPVPLSFEEKNTYLLWFAKAFVKLFIRLKAMSSESNLYIDLYPKEGSSANLKLITPGDRDGIYDGLGLYRKYGREGFALNFECSAVSQAHGGLDCTYQVIGSKLSGKVSIDSITVKGSYFDNIYVEYSFNPPQGFDSLIISPPLDQVLSPQEKKKRCEAVLDTILGDESHHGFTKTIKGLLSYRHDWSLEQNPISFTYVPLGDLVPRV
jgi:hypothetical protein